MSMITGRHKPSTPFFSFPPVPPLSHLDLKLTWEERGLYLTKPRMGLKFTKRSRYVRTLVLVEGFLRIRGMSRLWTLRWNRPGSIEGSFYFIFIWHFFLVDFFYVNKIDDDFIKSKPMRCSNFIDADSQLYIRTVQPFRIYIISLMSQAPAWEVSSCPRCAWGHRGMLAQQYTADTIYW